MKKNQVSCVVIARNVGTGAPIEEILGKGSPITESVVGGGQPISPAIA